MNITVEILDTLKVPRVDISQTTRILHGIDLYWHYYNPFEGYKFTTNIYNKLAIINDCLGTNILTAEVDEILQLGQSACFIKNKSELCSDIQLLLNENKENEKAIESENSVCQYYLTPDYNDSFY